MDIEVSAFRKFLAIECAAMPTGTVNRNYFCRDELLEILKWQILNDCTWTLNLEQGGRDATAGA